MRLKGKLAVDHWVGSPIAWILNFLAVCLSFILRRDHSIPPAPDKVLILKFVGIGSIARASFLFPSIKKSYPGASLYFACFPGCTSFVKLFKEIEQVIEVRDNNLFTLGIDTLRLLFWCWKERVDLVIDLEVHSKYSSIVTVLSFAKNRAGFGGITSRFRSGLYTHLVYWNPTKFVGIAYEQLLSALNVEPITKNYPPSPTREARKEVAQFLEDNRLDPEKDLLICVNVN